MIRDSELNHINGFAKLIEYTDFNGTAEVKIGEIECNTLIQGGSVIVKSAANANITFDLGIKDVDADYFNDVDADGTVGSITSVTASIDTGDTNRDVIITASGAVTQGQFLVVLNLNRYATNAGFVTPHV